MRKITLSAAALLLCTVAAHAEMQRIRPAVVVHGAETVLFDQVIDRHPALMLDVVGGAAEGSFVERHRRKTAGWSFAGRAGHQSMIRKSGNRFSEKIMLPLIC